MPANWNYLDLFLKTPFSFCQCHAWRLRPVPWLRVALGCRSLPRSRGQPRSSSHDTGPHADDDISNAALTSSAWVSDSSSSQQMVTLAQPRGSDVVLGQPCDYLGRRPRPRSPHPTSQPVLLHNAQGFSAASPPFASSMASVSSPPSSERPLRPPDQCPLTRLPSLVRCHTC